MPKPGLLAISGRIENTNWVENDVVTLEELNDLKGMLEG